MPRISSTRSRQLPVPARTSGGFKVGGPQMADVLAALNPWWWVRGGDAGPTLADSASGTQVGPGGGAWSAFPMPPPLHHGLVSGTDHAPHTESSAGLRRLYQQPGATRDGRKSFGVNTTGAGGSAASGWAATAASSWSNSDDPPITGSPFQMCFWYKWTAAVPVNNSGAATATAAILGFSTQLAVNGAWFWKDDRVNPATFNWAMRDSGNALWTGTWGTSPNDGNWHLIGAIITCDNGRNQSCTLYDNGVSLGTVTLTANAGSFAALGGEIHNFYLGEQPDFFIGPAGGTLLQDVAITTATSASPGFTHSDFVAMYAAR